MRIRDDEEEGIELPLVPMIDIMLVLLIFFMVATTLKVMQPQLPLTLPESAASINAKTGASSLLISIDHDARKYVNGTPVTKEELRSRLEQAALADASQPVQLDVDKDIRFEQMIEVLELCEFEGLKNVGFHTRTPIRRYHE